MDNAQIAQLLKNVAVAYEIMGQNRFRINAYNQAADTIAVMPTSVSEFWKTNKLNDIPGVGANIAGYLGELFSKGKVQHFEDLFSRMPKGTFELMKIRTIGPKTAVKLAEELDTSKYAGETVYDHLEHALEVHALQNIEGFGVKREEDIKEALKQFRQGQLKKKRMFLYEADLIAHQISTYLQQDKNVHKLDILGSLRRNKETIGDIDMACVTTNPTKTLDHFVSYPDMKTLVDRGTKGGTIITNNGVQIDLRIAEKNTYGAMLQYFTGSKYHNIKLREYALSRGYSISEYGIKKINQKNASRVSFADEKQFYNYLGLSWIPPEMREDRGEIEMAIEKKLPALVEMKQIKGDLHMHSNYDLISSHDIGTSPIEEHIILADKLGYEYIGFSDHNPKSSLTPHEITKILKERRKGLEHKFYNNKIVQNNNRVQKLFIMLEVDIKPNGELALPDEAFDHLDAVYVSIHSSFNQDKDSMTKRVLKALTYHPKVRLFAHPSGRLINKRNGVEAWWDEVYKVCLERDIALEINASADRLDLPDQLVWEARDHGVKFVIGTDSHNANAMHNMQYGVSVARRGWATQRDILNTYKVEEFSKWLLGSSVEKSSDV